MTRILLPIIIFAIAFATRGDWPVQKHEISEPGLGELARYDGDWFVREHRTQQRVVTDRGEDWIETYFQSHGTCGYFQWSMRMSYNLATDKYTAKIKWSEFADGFNSHRKLPWKEFDMNGRWDAASKTLSWTAESSDDRISKCVVKTVFDSPNHQLVSFSSDIAIDFPTGGYNYYRLW